MAPLSSKLKPTFSNRLALAATIGSIAIMPAIPSYAQILSTDNLPTLGLGSDAFQFDPLPSSDGTERFLAKYGQNAANLTSEENKTKNLSEMAQDYARQKAADVATDEISHWLSKAGNARLNINLDKQLSIKNTQLDWLIPWYDQPDLLLFSQHSIHRTDGRLQTNHGIGLRHFNQNSMMGLNTFFDHDLSYHHSRLGFGLEYAQDYAKISANSYLRLSSWRSTSELKDDYDARPANGWDIQVEGWLPTYSNLGANLKLEQYYGDDVALFGKNKRQKNPMATTVGVHWTPFPLLGINAEHKIGNGNTNETRVNLGLTWLLGKNLAQHLDASAVDATHRISSNRHDFVNRNNNIILEYQNKNLILLSLPQVIQGVTGEEVSIIRNLISEYPLEKIIVEAPELVAAGGSITLNGLKSSVKLPSYKIAENDVKNQQLNRYRLTVTAYDIKGNMSPQAETLVEVSNTGLLAIIHKNGTKKSNVIANGRDPNVFTVVIKDSLGHTVPNAKVNFTLPAGLTSFNQKNTSYYSLFNHFMWKAQVAKSASEQEFAIIANSKGEASIQFTASVSGSYALKASTQYGAEINEQFNFKPDIDQSFIGSIEIMQNNALADGNSKNKIKFHIVNNSRQSIAGAQVHFSGKNVAISPTIPTDEQGNTELEISSLTAGTTEIIATLNGDSRVIPVNFIDKNATNHSQENRIVYKGALFRQPTHKPAPQTDSLWHLFGQLF
ncbi:inverse autotransporter beta domain-containing protein [Providencia hangzhouensis]